MYDMEFVSDLPGSGAPAPRIDIDECVSQLQGRPGEWAMLCAYPTWATATTHKRRYRDRFPDIEWAVRTIDGQGCLYARHPQAGPQAVDDGPTDTH